MANFKRKRLWVDSDVQGSLIGRVVIYWVACVVTVELLNLAWQIATGPEQPTFFAYLFQHDLSSLCARLVISALLLVPIISDMLRLSNRFAGPVYRMKRVLRTIADGGPAELVSLRKDDYWHDLAEDMNAAIARLSAAGGETESATDVAGIPLLSH